MRPAATQSSGGLPDESPPASSPQPPLAANITGLQVVLGIISALLGSLMLVAPHQFATPQYVFLRGGLPWWGALYVVAGFGLLGSAALVPPWRTRLAAHLLAGGLFLVLSVGLAAVGQWSGGGNWAIFGVGTWLAFGVAQRPRPGQVTAAPDLLMLLIAAANALLGTLLLVAPGQFSSAVYNDLRQYFPVCGALFLSGGLALAAVQLRRPRRWAIVLAAHVVAASGLVVFLLVVTVPARNWTGTAYYGALAVALLVGLADRRRIIGLRPASLGARFGFAFAVAAALPLITGLAVATDRYERDAVAEALVRQQSLAMPVARDVADYVTLHLAAAVGLAQQPGFGRLDPAAQHRVLQAMAGGYPELFAFATFDAAGRPLARSDDLVSVPIVGQPEYVRARATMAPAVDAIISPLLGQPIFAMAAPLAEPDGSFGGVVVAVVKSDRVTDLLASATGEVGQRAYLVDESGRLLASSDAGLADTFADLSASPPVVALRASSAASGRERYAAAGGTQLAGYAAVPSLGWGIVVERQEAGLLATVHQGREAAYGILLVALAVAALFGAYAASRLAEPLVLLHGAIRRLALDESEAPLPLSQVSEVAALSSAFGVMRQRLAERTAERERAESAVRRQAALLDLAPVAVIVHRLDGQISYWNPGAEQTYGWTPGEALGRFADALLRTNVAPSYDTVQAQLMSSGRWEGEVRHVRRDGTQITVMSRQALQRNDDGQPSAILEINTDVTQRKLADEALLAANTELQQFAYTVSHDLKAPLVSIQGFAGRLQDRYAASLGDEGLRYVHRIHANADQLSHLITDVLEYSRVGRANADDLDHDVNANVDFGTILDELRLGLEGRLEQTGGAITIVEPLPEVRANTTALRQILANLLDNGLKYGGRAGGAPRVEVGAIARTTEWCVFVRDDGLGIPPAYHEQAFRLFGRLPDGKRRDPSGTGVGLATVKRAVRQIGGTVWIESDPARRPGTTFWFTVPRQSGATDVHEAPAEGTRVSSASTAVVQGRSL